MEESEKRKERLKAMRTAAAEAESFNNNGTLPDPSCLSNPLNELPGHQSVQEESGSAPRFDFYTNPMAAFSGNKRTNAANPTQQNYPTLNHGRQSNREFPSPSGPRNLESSPDPAHQWQTSFSLNQRPYQPHNPQQNFTPYQNPRGNFHSYPINKGFLPQGLNKPGPPSFYHPPNQPRGYNMSSPSNGNPNFPRSPSFPTSCPSHSSHPNFTSRHGEPQWRGNSNFQGQGRGQSYGRNPCGSGRGSGGRGLGFHGRGSGSRRPWGPERFYCKSMFEDPWEDLSPVIWTPIESPLTNFGARTIPFNQRNQKSRVLLTNSMVDRVLQNF